MRIPTSAIVMPLIAAVPFGLAIRDTVLHRDRASDLATERQIAEVSARIDAESAARAETERQRAIANEVVHRDERRALAAKELVGAQFVTAGPAFAGVALGARAPDGAKLLTVDGNPDGPALALEVPFTTDDPGCSTLTRVTARTWGEPVHDQVWLDLKTHHRASITDGCSLVFAEFQEPADWVAALPLDTVDKPSSALVRIYGRGTGDTWLAPGLDGDALTTISRVYATDHPDKTIGLTIETTATYEAWQHAADALAKRLAAKPTRDAGGDAIVRWKSPVPIRFERHADHVTLAVGAAAR